MTLPLDDVQFISVQVSSEPSVITVNSPGPQGPPGVFTLGSVVTTGPGSDAAATVSTNTDGIAVINLSIPRGDVGPFGSLAMGTVTSGATASATINGTPGNQTLNLVLPKGDQGPAGPAGAQGIQGIQGPQGTPGTNGKDGAGIQIAGEVAAYANLPSGLTSADAGKAWIVDADGKLYIWSGTSFPANGNGQTFVGPAGPATTLAIGTVTNGAAGGAAAATLTGSAPNQTLNLTLPTGATGPANTLAIGTVSTGASGTNAIATITGAAPNQTLNLTVPRGADGAAGATGPTGPQGPTGAGVLVLGATDPVPANTPANTVIYRPSVKTANFYWGSGTSFPSTGVGFGDTYFHTGLNGLFRYNGTAWRHQGPVQVADATARNTMSTNYSGILYPGFQVRQNDNGYTLEWDGAKWFKTPGIPTLVYQNENAGISGTIAPGTVAAGMINALGPIPAQVPGAIRVQVAGQISLAGGTSAGYLQIGYSPTTTFQSVIGTRQRYHNNGASQILSYSVEGTFYSDGTPKYLWLLGWNDPASNVGMAVFMDTWQAWLL